MTQDLLDQLWELDKEKSFARLTITPVKEGDSTYYDIDEVIKIRPYPNPFGYGGMFGMGTLRSEAEVKKWIDRLKVYLKVWQERGLGEVEIIRRPQVTRVGLKNLKRKERFENDAASGKKPDYKNSQLSLI